MKKTLKIIIAFVIYILILQNLSIATIDLNTTQVYSVGSVSNLLKYNGVIVYTTVVVYEKEGKQYPAYCMQKELDGVSSNYSYNVNTENLINNVMVWRVITNGYPYKTYSELGCANSEEAYVATKQAVYCILYDRSPNTYEAIGEAGQRCLNALNKIVSNARGTLVSKISADINLNDINENWQVDKLNKECIFKEFKISTLSTINNYTVGIQGNLPEGTKVVDLNNNEKMSFSSNENFKIIIPIKNINFSGEFNIKVNGKVNTKPIIYGKAESSNLQDYALTGAIYEDGEGNKKISYTNNETKITIIKQDEETNKKLEGVKFELLNENQQIILEELQTDKEGRIIIENLVPGTYFIKETRTLEGYSIYNKLIKVELELNENAKVTINNNEKEPTIEEKKGYEINLSNKNTERTVKLPKTGM